MLKLRVMTALVLIPLVLWGIFYASQIYFVAGCTLIIGLAAREWAQLAGITEPWKRSLYVLIILILLVVLRIGSYILQSEFVLGIGTLWWMLIAGYLVYVRNKPALPFWPKWLVAISGLLSLTLCWEALLILHVQPQLLLFMLVLIWAADTFAYFGGRLWGKHKLAVSISPNKTWEGLACGVIASLMIGVIGEWFWITPHQLNLGFLLAIALTILISAAGDLFESLLKRERGLKDSGNLLPGHGGVLDRIDSLIAAAPVFTYCIIAMGLLL